MRRIFLIVFLTSAVTFAQTQTAGLKADQKSKAEEEIKNLEFELADLLMKGDFETYFSYVADDYVRIDALGRKMTRDEVFAQFKSSKAGVLMPDSLKVRIYGDTAILNGHLRIQQEVGGKPVTRGALFTKVFVKHNGRWIMVNNQGTPVGKASGDHP